MPGLHIVVMVVSNVANTFLTLSQAILTHVNTLITTSQASPALWSIVQLLQAATIAVTIEGMHVSSLVSSCIANLNKRDMAKQLLTSLRLIARMNFSLKNYTCELLNLSGTVGKVELIPAFTAAVCENWNVSDKYTWDNAGDLKELSVDQALSEDNRSD